MSCACDTRQCSVVSLAAVPMKAVVSIAACHVRIEPFYLVQAQACVR